jgi:hypothetical protein
MDRDTGNTGHMTQRNRNQKKNKDNKNDKEYGLTKQKQLLTNPNQFPLLKTHTKVQYYS